METDQLLWGGGSAGKCGKLFGNSHLERGTLDQMEIAADARVFRNGSACGVSSNSTVYLVIVLSVKFMYRKSQTYKQGIGHVGTHKRRTDLLSLVCLKWINYSNDYTFIVHLHIEFNVIVWKCFQISEILCLKTNNYNTFQEIKMLKKRNRLALLFSIRLRLCSVAHLRFQIIMSFNRECERTLTLLRNIFV